MYLRRQRFPYVKFFFFEVSLFTLVSTSREPLKRSTKTDTSKSTDDRQPQKGRAPCKADHLRPYRQAIRDTPESRIARLLLPVREGGRPARAQEQAIDLEPPKVTRLPLAVVQLRVKRLSFPFIQRDLNSYYFVSFLFFLSSFFGRLRDSFINLSVS
jgi:hypothetical protein